MAFALSKLFFNVSVRAFFFFRFFLNDKVRKRVVKFLHLLSDWRQSSITDRHIYNIKVQPGMKLSTTGLMLTLANSSAFALFTFSSNCVVLFDSR